MPGYFVQAEALYFQARESGVSYAIVNERVVHPDFQSRFGGRAKIGVDLGHDCWQLWVQFLHYHARTTEKKVGKEFFPTWGHPLRGAGGHADEVFNRWRLHMGFLDVNLACPWGVSECLELWPFWGLRFAGVRHKLRIDYRGGTLFPGVEEDLSMKNKFWGLGPEMGVEAFWRLNSWLRIFSRGACSLLFGEFYIHQDEESRGKKEAGALKFYDEYDQTKKVLEMSLGLDFQYCQFYARVGWEIYLLMGQNQLVRFVDESMPGKFVGNLGDLSLHGLSFGLGLKF
ncbi:MAG: hypothetical protein K1000chlam2_01062 [Chlamydiae bacterium]|nr:hypothetical protein [Chlamydiota bacterium]